MPQRWLGGASSASRSRDSPKKTKTTTFKPAARKTPAAITIIASHTQVRCASAAACKTSDLVMKPAVSGADMASAPKMAKPVVTGICRARPPRSVQSRLPVCTITAPMAISSNALYTMWAKACAATPLSASSVPMPMPAIMKPTWLMMA